MRLGIDPQIVDHLRLEEEAGELDLGAEQALRRGTQRRHRERRIGEVSLGRRGEANPRAQPGLPALLVLDQEEAAQRPQVIAEGGLTERLLRSPRLSGHPPDRQRLDCLGDTKVVGHRWGRGAIQERADRDAPARQAALKQRHRPHWDRRNAAGAGVVDRLALRSR